MFDSKSTLIQPEPFRDCSQHARLPDVSSHARVPPPLSEHQRLDYWIGKLKCALRFVQPGHLKEMVTQTVIPKSLGVVLWFVALPILGVGGTLKSDFMK